MGDDGVRTVNTGIAWVRDDGSPRAALEAAAEFMRAAVHRSAGMLTDGRLGWEHPSDVYDCVGELEVLTRRLTPLLDRLGEAVRVHERDGRLGVAYGSPSADAASLARAVSATLAGATSSAGLLGERLSEVQALLGDAVGLDAPPHEPPVPPGPPARRGLRVVGEGE